MFNRGSSIAWCATLLLGSLIGCSDQEGSTVDSGAPASSGARPSTGGAGTLGGSGSHVPTAGTSTSSSAGSGGRTNAPTNASTEACQGLPIELDEEAQAGAPSANEACNGVSVEAEAVPVDVFVIMDRSQSMAERVKGGTLTRWAALHDAVESFTQDQSAAEIRAGIGFFSRSGSGDDGHDCDPAVYAEPRVPIGLVSEVGPDLVGAMDEVTPGGLTPTVPAVQGAISYARTWAQENPGRATLVVLVTDGFPTQCENDPGKISEATRVGYESPERIRTFVIGVGDVAKFNLDNYARAGGTIHAYLTDAGDVTTSFVSALNNITNRALACEYQLPAPPDGMKLDPEKVQVVYTPSTGGAEEVPSITSLAACSKNANGGWYYDDPEHPTKISVCPCTCSRFQAGRVDVRLGCKPRLGLR